MRSKGLLLVLFLVTQTLLAESLKSYKELKHRQVEKTESGEAVKVSCEDGYTQTCRRSCSDDACRAKCAIDAKPYCRARADQQSKAEAELVLKAALLLLGPLVTLLDGPRYFAYTPDEFNPYRLIWNYPSFYVDFGAGLLQAKTYGLSTSAGVRFGHFGLGLNAAYFNQSGDTLGEFDVGPALYLGSTHIASAILPVLLGSTGSGTKPEYGFGVRTHTTFYLDRVYVLFTPMLGKINDLWNFQLRAGLGFRLNEMWAIHAAFEHRSVVDLATLAISEASLNGGFLYLSFRVN